MSEFKVGDAVKYVSNKNELAAVTLTIGKKYTVRDVDDLHIRVVADDDGDSCFAQKSNFRLVAARDSTYTLSCKITIPALLAKAPSCDEWRKHFVALLTGFPEGVDDSNKDEFFSAAPSRVLDWLEEKGFIAKAERKLSAGDRLRDEAGQEYLLVNDNDADFLLVKLSTHKRVGGYLPASLLKNQAHPTLDEINEKWDSRTGKLTLSA